METTTTSDPKPRRLLDDLLLIEQYDPWTREVGMSTNSYVLLAEGKALLVDATFDHLLPRARAMGSEAHDPVALLLTHRHVAPQVGGEALEAFREEFGAPVFLHPLDANHPQGISVGLEFRDPTDSPLLAAFGVEAVHFPGQTEGSVMLYRKRDGLLLAGDSAMGNTGPQADRGIERLVRPPFFTSVNDEQLRRNWLRFDRSVAHFTPFHGAVFIDRAGDMEGIMRPLLREEMTQGLEG